MINRVRLSQTNAGRRWLNQFSPVDQSAAAALLNAMLLLDAEQVASAQRAGLEELVIERHGIRGFRRRAIALYAERELAEAAVFISEPFTDRKGKLRDRAVGPTRVAPIAPRRGSARVGSEGPAASVIAQAVERWRRIFINHPGPEIIRKRKPGLIVIVTDFIGSGSRVCGMLDKFWHVPSVRSWWSLGWIRFAVVAAAGIKEGLEVVEGHRTAPRTLVRHLVPTVRSVEPALARRWEALMVSYGPRTGRGAPVTGFGDNGALVAFSYRIPNNTPAMVHAGGGGWTPLFDGPVPEDAEIAFARPTKADRIAVAAAEVGIEAIGELPPEESEVLIVLRSIRGRWRPGAEMELAERTGLHKTEVEAARQRADDQGFLDANGRLTDDGQLAIQAGLRGGRKPGQSHFKLGPRLW